ncbi:hypothetical protein D1872_130200 [compost metagenome]
MENNFYGKFRAIVEDVNDPEKRGRILVTCPTINDSDELGWAEACLPPGVFSLPKKGDSVYIEFEEGDIQYPVWVGILPTNTYIKETFFKTASYDPTKKINVNTDILTKNITAEKIETKEAKATVKTETPLVTTDSINTKDFASTNDITVAGIKVKQSIDALKG